LKVALILNGSITDASWNANGYNALVAAKEKIGFQFAYIENVQTADMEATFRDYAEQGYQLILGHGSQFEDAVTAVAPSYPQTYFFVFNGEVANGVNSCSYRTATDENTFVSGALAALMSKTGTIGWIGAMEVPTTSEALDGYTAGAAYAKPEVKVLSAYVGSYNDAAKAKELALTMFESKADIIQSNANQGTAGIIEAAKNFGNNVMLIGNTTDQYELAPELFLTSNITNFSAVYSIVIKSVIDGTFDPTVKAVGMKEGCMDIAPYHNFDSVVPAEVKTKIEQIKQDIAAGKLNDVLPAEYPGRVKSK
jgi:basic membrane protein A